MAGQPLSPATRRRLGGPLPRQLANRRSSAPIAPGPEGSPTFDPCGLIRRGLIAYYNPFREIIRVSGIRELPITHPYAALLGLRLSRSTCMPKPRRQRSF